MKLITTSFRAVFPLLVASSIPAAADFGNVIVNGDFENGLAGWSIAATGKPGYIYNDPALTPEVYTGTGPATLKNYQGGASGSTTANTAAYSGGSAGWFRTGPASSITVGSLPGGFLYNYLYQDIYVTPNEEYTIESATFKAFAWNGYNGAKNDINEVAAMFLIRIDDQIDSVYDPNNSATFKFRNTTWNLASKGNWLDKQLTPGQKFTSTTGRIQVQLHFQDGFFDRNYIGEYATVGFDSLYIGLNKPVVPEPSSMLVMAGGIAGLIPVFLKKRK